MANYRTGADLLADVLFRVGERSGSPFQDQALSYINRAWQGIWAGGGELDPEVQETWWWLHNRAALHLEPQITDTVSGTLGATTVTFDTGPTPLIDSDVSGWWMRVDGVPDIIRLGSLSSGTIYNLGYQDDGYFGGPTVTSANCWLWKTDYTLRTDIVDLWGPMRVMQGEQEQIHEAKDRLLDMRFPITRQYMGTPSYYSLTHSGGTQVIRFSHGGRTDGQLIAVEYDYTDRPADIANDTTEPPIPLRHRKILADYATGLIFTDKNDDRAEFHLNLAKSGLKAMEMENRSRLGRVGSPFIFRARRNPVADSRHIRTESGQIVYWNGWSY